MNLNHVWKVVTGVLFTICTLYQSEGYPTDLRVTQSSSNSIQYETKTSVFTCTACVAAVGLARDLLKWKVSRATITKRLASFCSTFGIEDNVVCNGMVDEFSDEFLTSLAGTKLDDHEMCDVMLGSACSSSAYDPALEWSVHLPDTPKPVPSTKKPRKDGPRLRILQLADIHLDRLYTPGSNANCKDPLCCQNTSGVPDTPADAAGYWGFLDKPCDIPERTLDHLFAHLAQNETFDIIYWTGDLPAHDVWKQSREQQDSVLELLTSKLLKYFPSTPIYPVLGNHESYPVDSYPPPFITGNRSESWLYNTLAKTWSKWLPASAIQTVRYAAYYTVLVKPGFRVVTMNTNYCDHKNFWLALNVTDPAHELQWLIQVLQAAEDKQEKVHILGHIPQGSADCLRVWSKNFGKIVVRYSNTIAAHFLAHTHYDHFELTYDPASHDPVLVSYISPSVTTFTGAKGVHPGYRVYTVDGDYANSTWSVLDHATTIFNMTSANLDNTTTWKPLYSVKSAYDMPDLSPSSWHELTTRLHSNDTLFNAFYNHYYKMSTPGSCDSTCRESMICKLRTAVDGDTTYCSIKYSTTEKLHVFEKSLPKAC